MPDDDFGVLLGYPASDASIVDLDSTVPVDDDEVVAVGKANLPRSSAPLKQRVERVGVDDVVDGRELSGVDSPDGTHRERDRRGHRFPLGHGRRCERYRTGVSDVLVAHGVSDTLSEQ